MGTLTTEQVERHTRIAHRLDNELRERRFWLMIQVDSDNDGREDEAFDAGAVNIDKWLRGRPLDAPSEETFHLAGWDLTLRAYPKGEDALKRGGTIIGNPFPSPAAYWVNG